MTRIKTHLCNVCVYVLFAFFLIVSQGSFAANQTPSNQAALNSVKKSELVSHGISESYYPIFGIVLLLFMFIFSVYKGKTTPSESSLHPEQQGERSDKELQWFLLALSGLFLIIDRIFSIFIQPSDTFTLINVIIAGICLIGFVLLSSQKLKLTQGKIILGSLHLILSILLILRTINAPEQLIPFALFCVLVFASYSLYSEIRLFWLYSLLLSILLFVIWLNGYFSGKQTSVYFSTLFFLGAINYARHLIRKNTERYLHFTNSIVNHGSSLIVGSNANEELVFVSENVKDILGYNKKDLHSNNWFTKTLAPEDRQDLIFEKVRAAKRTGEIYSRKMKTAWGTYKSVQWQYKKFGNNLWVGIGQEVTDYIKIQEQYQTLIQSASDIIHKTDTQGLFTFFNHHLEHLLGYEAKELIGKPYTVLIRKDHIKRLQNFYANSEYGKGLETIEFPALKKSGEEIWLSQNMTVERNQNGEIISYNSILRDITIPKQLEQDNLNKQLKIELHSKLLRELTFIATSNNEAFENIIRQLIEKSSVGLKVDRISIWYCVDGHIRSDCFYEKKDKKFWTDKILIAKENHPLYFSLLKKGEIIAAENVLEHDATKEFFKDYFSEHHTQSLLDVPIFIEGEMEGVLCCESTEQKRVWDAEDINFSRSVAGLITLAIEANKRKLLEAQLEERSKILASIGTITEKLLVSKDPLKTLGENLYLIGDVLKCERVYLYQNKLQEKTLELNKAWYKFEDTLPCAPNWREDFLFDSVNNFFNKHSRNIHFSLLTKNLQVGDFKSLLESQKVLSMLILPIQSGNDFIGFLGIDDSSTERTWSRDHITLMYSLITNVVNSLQRLRSEKAILESESNFRQINETIKDVFWLYDNLKQKYLYISPSCEDILGMSQKEFYNGVNFGDQNVLEEDRHHYINALNSLKTEASYEIEYRIRTPEGAIRWISEKSSAIRNENKELIRNTGICSDITEQKEILNKIRQLSLVAEKTNNGVVILDRNGFIVWANSSYLTILDSTHEKILNRRPSDFIIFKKNQGDKNPDAINGTNYTVVYELETHSENKKWIEVNNTIIEDDGGKIIQQIQIITDITQKRLKNLELAQHRSMLRKYSSFLEYQNELKEKLMLASSLEEISKVALSFVKENIKNCIHISLLTLDEKKQNLSGYFIFDEKIQRERHSVKTFKSFNTVKTGEMFIEPDLLGNQEKSSSDKILIEHGTLSYMVLPLMDLNDVIGVLTISFSTVFNYTESEKENLKNLATHFSTTIQKLNLKNYLQEKNNDIRDSLLYARNIQKAILPDLKSDLPSLQNIVLVFKPKDIVSGDFYWAKENEKHIFLALGDCTGHGVPGAFLTIIGTRILEQIIRDDKLTEPDQILSELDKQIYYALNAGNKGLIRDGMEIALCVFDKVTRSLHFSGVGMGLVYHLDGEEFYLKGSRGSVGDFEFNDAGFERYSISLSGREHFYMSSDGYQDQLGGDNYKRYSKRRLMDELIKIHPLDASEQELILKDNLKNHMKDNFQTDDISLLGFQLKLQ